MARAFERSAWRAAVAVGGGLAFALSLLYFAAQYAVGFDDQPPAPGGTAPAVLTNVLLFTGFALHHSIFARTGLKARLGRVIHPSLERTTYVWISSILFALLCAIWRDVPGVVWAFDGALGWALRGVQLAAAIFTLVSARHLDVLDLSGVRQALGMPPARAQALDDSGPYRLVRHPIYFAWLFLVWAAPLMDGTRLVFAVTSSAYLIAAIPFEERDLRRTFGGAYETYARRVRFRLIPGIY